MRVILSHFLLTVALLTLNAEGKAQAQNSSCPAVKVEFKPGKPFFQDSPEMACPGDKLIFTASVDGLAPLDKPVFNWTVSSGEITSGQGTSSITVATDEMNGGDVTATVEVDGVQSLKAECGRRALKRVGVATCCFPCPTISISCPTEIREPGAPETVSVNISGRFRDLAPKYKWQVSAGKIISGQGTPEILVDTSEVAGQSITATVEIDGLPPECDRTESCTLPILEPAPDARKFDEYGDVSWISEEARLVNFGFQLREEPGAQAFIIIYGARGRADEHLTRVRKFLVERQGIDQSRIQLINGGYNKKAKVELWLVPTGAASPTANPDF
jgi:hypothetical protein